MSNLHEQLFQACYLGKSIENVLNLIQQGANIQWRNSHYVSYCWYEVIIIVVIMISMIICYDIIIVMIIVFIIVDIEYNDEYYFVST